MNEYLAYMTVLGERIDGKKITEAEAEYELARKLVELQERAAIARARSAAEQAATAQSAAGIAASQQTAKDNAARLAAEEERLASIRDAATRQQKAEDSQRRAELFQQSLQLLFPSRSKPVNCIGRWFAGNWVQTCN